MFRLAHSNTGQGCILVTGSELGLVPWLELTHWNSCIMGNLDHCFDCRSSSEFSPPRPSKNSILFPANLGMLALSSTSSSMFSNWRENAAFHIIVRGLFSLGRSWAMINLLGALSCFTYSGTVFSLEANSRTEGWLFPGCSQKSEIWL